MLSPHEEEKLLLSWAAELARRRKARGIKLNYPESVVILADYVLEFAREGKPMQEIIDGVQKVLTEDDVMPEVPFLIDTLQVEATFPDGTKLVTVRNPIKATKDLKWIRVKSGEIEVKPKGILDVTVVNTGDRPIQVSSHFHFLETNSALKFDRASSFVRGWISPPVLLLDSNQVKKKGSPSVTLEVPVG